MPVEPIGLIIGVIGLIGLFTTCIDLIDAISCFKAHDKDYEYLICRLETERVLLWQWGAAVGFCQSPDGTLDQHGYSAYLDNKNTFNAVNQILACLVGRFQNAHDLVNKYGPQHQLTDQVMYARSGHNSRMNSGQERVSSKISLAAKARWTIHGRTKLLGLVDEITELSKNLRRLVPTNRPVAVEVGRALSEIISGLDFERLVFELLRELGPSLISSTVGSRHSGLIEHDIRRVSEVHDGQQHIAAGSAAGRHSYKELLLADESTRVNNPPSRREHVTEETSAGAGTSDNMLVTTHAKSSPTECIQSSNPPEQQPRKDCVYVILFISFVYMIISLMVVISLSLAL